MNKRIEELALESGLAYRRSDGRCWIDAGFVDADLERFAELVRADERKACAKLCESMGVHPALNVWGGGPDWYKRQKECAAAIRTRGEHE